MRSGLEQSLSNRLGGRWLTREISILEEVRIRGVVQGVVDGTRSRRRRRRSNGPQITQAAEHKRVIRVSDTITVSTLAHEMGVKSSEIIKFLMGMGMMMTVNQPLDVETAELVAQEFGFSIQDVSFKEEEFLVSDEDSPEDLELRPPCVTGHGSRRSWKDFFVGCDSRHAYHGV